MAFDWNTVITLLSPSFLGPQGSPQPAPVKAPGAPYSAIYAFGDSLSDAGNDYVATLNKVPASPPYFEGHFTNGLTWVEQLGQILGVPNVQASLNGGTDYAFGGAETGSTPVHDETAIDLGTQRQTFEAAHPQAPSDALYTVWAGSNDLLDLLGTAGANVDDVVNAAIANTTDFVGKLVADGARSVMVLDVPDLGKTPDSLANGAAYQQVASQLSQWYDWNLWLAMSNLSQTANFNLSFVDTFSLLNNVAADPGSYGFGNVTQPTWTGDLTDPNSGTLNEPPQGAGANLYFDTLHPTAATHGVLASMVSHWVPA